jgi:long-chain acyl-CoA synthetase
MVAEDMPALKPTFFVSVPRVFNRIFGVIQDKLNAAKKTEQGPFIEKAISEKLAQLNETGVVTHPDYDPALFSKFRAIVGGNVKIMLTGSAPIAKDVLDFLKICFCCPVLEGYGMTETSAGSCVTIA